MKTIWRLLFMMFLAIAISNCSDDSTGPGDDGNGNGGGNGQASPGQMALNINGNAWSSFVATGFINLQGNNATTISIGGTSNTGETFAIALATVTGAITEQSYTNDLTMGYAIAASFGSVADSTQNAISNTTSPASITFSEIDLTNNTVSGTFEVDLVNSISNQTVEVRNGAFNKVVVNVQTIAEE